MGVNLAYAVIIVQMPPCMGHLDNICGRVSSVQIKGLLWA